MLQAVKYTEPASGVATVFYNDGSDYLTQGAYLCDPDDPGTPLGTADNPLPVTDEDAAATLTDVLGAIKSTNKLLFLMLRTLTERK